MSLREKINQNPAIAAGVVAVVVVASLAYVLWPRGGGVDGKTTTTEGGLYFTEDDGKTTFVAPPSSIPGAFKGPGGQTAYRAVMIQYPGSPREVGWLENYTARGQKLLQEFYADAKNQKLPPPVEGNIELEKLVKKPGDNAWISRGRQPEQAMQITNPPQKNGEGAMIVLPGSEGK